MSGNLQDRVVRLERKLNQIENESFRRMHEDSRKARGIAAPLAGKPERAVRVPASYWGDRVEDEVSGLLNVLPIVSVVVGPFSPLSPEEGLSEDEAASRFNAEVQRRTNALIAAYKVVRESLRKGF